MAPKAIAAEKSAKCGSQVHTADDCKQTVKCPNCEGSHPAYSRACSCWRQEKDIESVKGKENVTYFEAKKWLAFSKQGSFAEAVRREPALSTASVETQDNPGDLESSRMSPSYVRHEEWLSGPSDVTKKSGCASAKTTPLSQVMALPTPPNENSKARSSAQQPFTSLPSTSLLPKGRGRPKRNKS